MVSSLAAILLIALSAPTDVQPAANDVPAEAAKPVKPKKICRLSDEEASESRMRKKICKSAEEWGTTKSARQTAN